MTGICVRFRRRGRYPVTLPSRGGLIVYATTPIQVRILQSCERIIALTSTPDEGEERHSGKPKA